MTSTISSTNKNPGLNTRYWWVEILLGIGFIALSFWFYATPIETYISLAVFFSYVMFISGIFEIINAISFIKTSKQWGIFLIGGIIDLVLGYLLITNENLTMEILPVLLGIWFVIRSLIFFITYASQKIGSASISAILSSVPPIGSVLGFFILGELLGIYGWLSLILITPGILLVVLKRE